MGPLWVCSKQSPRKCTAHRCKRCSAMQKSLDHTTLSGTRKRIFKHVALWSSTGCPFQRCAQARCFTPLPRPHFTAQEVICWKNHQSLFSDSSLQRIVHGIKRARLRASSKATGISRHIEVFQTWSVAAGCHSARLLPSHFSVFASMSAEQSHSCLHCGSL